MFTGQHTYQNDAHSSPYCGKRYSAQCKVFPEHFMCYLVFFVGESMLAKYSSIFLLYFTHGLRQTWYSAHAMSLCVDVSVWAVMQRLAAPASVLSLNGPLSVVNWTRVHDVRLFHWSSYDSIHPHSPPSLKLSWSSHGAWPQPCPRSSSPPRVAPWRVVTILNIQHPASILGAQVLPLLAVISICFSHFDTHIVSWCSPCKTGTNTHAFTTTMGGRDRIWQLYIQSLNSQPLSDSTENHQVTSRNSSRDKIGQCHCWVTLQFTVWKLYDWYSLFCLDLFCQWG